MAEEIEKQFGIKPRLIKGSGGVFEVNLNGEKLFSKAATGRFPEAGEVEESLREALSGQAVGT